MYVLKCYLMFCCLVPSLCANILGLFPAQFKSHYIIFDSVMTELAKRGHNITVISPFPKPEPVVNFTDIDVKNCDQMPLDDIFDMDQAYKSYNSFTQLQIMLSLAPLLEPIIRCETVTRLLKSDQSFDLIITEIFHTDIMLAFTSKYRVPFISFSALPLFPWAADRVGNPSNPSYIRYPFSDTPLDQKNPTFYQRLMNTVYYLYAQVMWFQTNQRVQEMAETYFQAAPHLSEIAKNTSLVFTFSHFSFNAPVPLVPNVVEISGVQIKPASPLPLEIQNFIDHSEYGVIYFCMGSLLRAETMPEAKRIAFLDAFAKVPQRIIWKWGSDHLPGKTDKIYAAKWMPQRDILAHPKVKLFISHGGALGLNEAVYEGVPVLGIPMYADQVTNLKVLQSHGAAEILHYTDITNDTLLIRIQQVLNKSYCNNMKKVSRIYKDRPMSPMDTAIYWINYVIRHKGAHHLRSHARILPLYQYLLLDVIAFLFTVTFCFIFSMFYLFKNLLKLTRKVLQSNSKKTN